MLDVEVENFQSIEHTRLRIDKFTALVGRSNIGKSALIRAIRCALTGASGTDFVRHGLLCERLLNESTKRCRCQTTVRIVAPTISIVWEKGDGINRYTVKRAGGPEEVFDKPGSGTPDFLRPDFAPLRIGDTEALLQVSEQFNPIFLLGSSGAVIADVLSDVARLDKINEAVRLVSKDRKDAVALRGVREKDAVALAGELVAFAALDVTAARVQKTEAAFGAIQAKEAEVKAVRRFLASADVLDGQVRALEQILNVKTPDPSSVRTTHTQLSQVGRFHAAYDSRSAVVERLSGIDQVNLPTPTGLKRAREAYAKAATCHGKASGLKAFFDRVKALRFAKAPDPVPAQALAEQLRTLDRLSRREQDARRSIEQIQERLAAAIEEQGAVLQELREIGVCPTCSQPVGEGHSLNLEETP